MYKFINLLLLSGLISSVASTTELKSPALYQNEEQAIEAGEKLGLGSAVIEKPKKAEVFSYQTVKLVYTTGKAGINPGGGIRIAMRHVARWTFPQTEKPNADGYLTVKTTDNAPTEITVGYKSSPFFGQYHPWQNIVEIKLPRGLAPQETVRVTYGDKSGGSRGIRTQPFDETSFVFKFYVDATGDENYLPLRHNPSLEIIPGAPYRLGIVMPSDAVTGKPTWCIVRVEDRYGNPTDKYLGTVTLSSTDSSATLPTGHTFARKEKGAYRFDNVVFNSSGRHTITVRDEENPQLVRVSNPVRVNEKDPEPLLLWGDLHGHTLFSDGRGTVEEYYDFAENVAGLDFCAVSDHAFEMLDWMWEHSKKVTNSAYKPGKFVTFQAYEWSGKADVGGDHNIYFLDDDPPIYRSRSYYNYKNLQMYHGPEPQVNHIEDIFRHLSNHLKNKDVFCIPHWGGRHGNPNWHHPKVQRMIEVFSEHRRSEDWMITFLKN
ncbi:MAG: DUF3604 domain-containing protein, partial [Planctomycetota bacterium]